MNARGSTEIIVASIGLSMGVLTQNLFTMIVTMAIFTTTAMPPMLRRALADLPMGADEKKRVEHEALDERGFVTNLERILLAVDDSRLGKFTARIAGLIAGAHGIPLTIVHLGEESATERPDGPSKQVKAGAKTSATVMRKDASEPNPEKVHLTTRSITHETEGAIVEEARKGFDLMLVGVAETHDSEGAFDPKVTKLIKEFKGDVAIMASRGVGRVQNLGQNLRILVPINGSPIARRAAEIAIAIARPTRAHVTALYVSSNDRKRRGRIVARNFEEGALREIAELGERFEVQVLTALETRSSADKAILNRAAKGYGLIVMGASQRPGDEVFFGNTANVILKKWKGAVLLVAT